MRPESQATPAAKARAYAFSTRSSQGLGNTSVVMQSGRWSLKEGVEIAGPRPTNPSAGTGYLLSTTTNILEARPRKCDSSESMALKAGSRICG